MQLLPYKRGGGLWVACDATATNVSNLALDLITAEPWGSQPHRTTHRPPSEPRRREKGSLVQTTAGIYMQNDVGVEPDGTCGLSSLTFPYQVTYHSSMYI